MPFTSLNLAVLVSALVVTLLVLQVVQRNTDNCIIVITGHHAETNCPPSLELAEVLKYLKPHHHG
ncbi:tgb3 [Tamus red mosaic virus]|uniref:Movement protein TGBp3 n=1 Tax=Tamus red mosaic virus TaxID=1081702 RepID=G3LHV7_9VIRU|nr:tgb3 [Tamus red mosaic virus]AEO12143.1 tgb3 [Tamus red mosaic virus]